MALFDQPSRFFLGHTPPPYPPIPVAKWHTALSSPPRPIQTPITAKFAWSDLSHLMANCSYYCLYRVIILSDNYRWDQPLLCCLLEGGQMVGYVSIIKQTARKWKPIVVI